MTIASEITRLQTAKADIKTAIQGKWVSVPASAKLDTYDTYINQIVTGSWSEIHYWTGKNYNWNGNMESWHWSTWYKFVYDTTQRELSYGNIIRFETPTHYVFGWFMYVYGSPNSNYDKMYVCPFEYFTINKSTNQLTLLRAGVSNITTAASDSSAYYWNNYQSLYPQNTWREYTTEFRTYYYEHNYSKNYDNRNGNVAWYFYIKKDLSAAGYVKADDAAYWASRWTYWEVHTSYDAEWNDTYPHDFPSLFSNYNVNFIREYTASPKYYDKLYTPCWYEFDQNSWNDGYGYAKMFYITDN